MMRHPIMALTGVWLSVAMALPSWASQQSEALYDALKLDAVIAIMREEGLDYGAELRAGMFPDRAADTWKETVAEIHDEERMRETVRSAFGAALEGTDTAPLVEFFTSDPGRRIVELEIEARRAMMDPAVEEAAEAAFDEMKRSDAPRLDALDAYIDANDLIEQNVVGAMNANFAFYSGLMDGGYGEGASEDRILSDVWAQEPQIRADTTEWVYSYLTLAYGPLGDDDIEAYTALSETPAGQTLNNALFKAFDELYVGISRRLGREAAQVLAGEEI